MKNSRSVLFLYNICSHLCASLVFTWATIPSSNLFPTMTIGTLLSPNKPCFSHSCTHVAIASKLLRRLTSYTKTTAFTFLHVVTICLIAALSRSN